MTSTKGLEDSLPLTGPAVEDDFSYLDPTKIAVYTLLALNDGQLSQLEQDVRAADEDACTPATLSTTQSVFHGQRLLDVYNHHIRTRDDEFGFHPFYFIVADQENWAESGVLFVHLAASTWQHDHFVGVCRCDLETASQIGPNLDMANSDWEHCKEMEQDEFGGEDPYENPRYFPDDAFASCA